MREETGVLPVIAKGDFDAFWRAGDEGLARAGTRAALFHPLTSYSLPDAVRFALHIAALPDLSGAALAKASHDMRAQALAKRGLSTGCWRRMLFGAAEPEHRYTMLRTVLSPCPKA